MDTNTIRTLLVELFVEELPPKALKRLGEAFGQTLHDALRAQGLLAEGAALTNYASPRRLAARVGAVRAVAPPKAVSHKLFAIRGLCMFLKVTVGMTLFRDPALRARSNYDRRPDAARETPRVRALPVVRATDEADAMKEAV